MTDPLDMSPIAQLTRFRSRALADAEMRDENGVNSQASYGEARAYATAIALLEAAARPAPVVEQFRCGFDYGKDWAPSTCQKVATYVDPDGDRWCVHHAPHDVELTIAEHDDQRAAL